MVDSGASIHLKMKSYFAKLQESSTVVLTDNGEVHTNEEARLYVHDLNLFVAEQVLK